MKAISWCLIAWVTVTSSLQAGDEDLARFRREYPEALKKIQVRYSQFRGKCTFQPGSLYSSTGSFAIDNDMAKVELTFAAASLVRGSGRVLCANKDWEFDLKKSYFRGTYSLEEYSEIAKHGPSVGRS